MFWLLGKSPEKQEKLYQEILTNVGSSAVTASHLGHLPYLKACIKESFRYVNHLQYSTMYDPTKGLNPEIRQDVILTITKLHD